MKTLAGLSEYVAAPFSVHPAASLMTVVRFCRSTDHSRVSVLVGAMPSSAIRVRNRRTAWLLGPTFTVITTRAGSKPWPSSHSARSHPSAGGATVRQASTRSTPARLRQSRHRASSARVPKPVWKSCSASAGPSQPDSASASSQASSQW